MNVFKNLNILSRNGLLHYLRIIYVCFFLSLKIKAITFFLIFYPKVKNIVEKYCFKNREINYWRKKKEELLRLGKKGYRIKIEDLELCQEKLELLKKAEQQSHEVVIAEIDQDGFLLSHFGLIGNAPTVSKENFLSRKRFNLKLVDIEGYVGVKKDYNGNWLSFVNEIKAIHYLGLVGCRVPAIIDVDFDNFSLTCSYILGPVLREELAKKGAVLRDRDVDNKSDFVRLSVEELRLKRIKEGNRFLYDVIDLQFVNDLFTELNKIHNSHFIYNDIKYGNIIIEKKLGKPYLIDFEGARPYQSLGKNSFRILRDKNIEEFNLHFNTEKLTYKRMKEEIKRIKDNNMIYAPVYFGAGLRLGSIWSLDAGYGRWHYILKNSLPPISGKRILDLGANNAFNSIQMLRDGAREVIGIELDAKYIIQGNFVKAGFEWIDNTQYNFRYIQSNMVEISAINLGKFDIVLALCSLYYLDEDSIIKLVKHISTITDIFILQCNIETNMVRSDPGTFKKSSIDYAIKVLRCNGFPVIRVIAPYKYTRPLVIGEKEKINTS